MSETNLQTYSDGFMQVKLNRVKLEIAVQELQQKLHETQERKDLEEMKQQLNQAIKSEEEIKDGILQGMIQNWLKTLEFDDGKFTKKQNPASLKINDEELIPEEFKHEETKVVIDKKAIKESIQNWNDVAGCELTHSFSLVFTSK